MDYKATIAEAPQHDVGRHIARVPSHIMEQLDLQSGDVIEIEGRSVAVASVRRAPVQDEEQNIIRIDGFVRYNAEASMGDTVTIRKTQCTPAASLTLTPTQQVKFSGNPTAYFHQKLLDMPLLRNQKIAIDILGKQLVYVVTKTNPKQCIKVTKDTNITISESTTDLESLNIPEVSYEDIGGLQKEIEMIREMVELPLKHPEVFERLGIGAPKGVMLTGPPGTGKTLLAKAVASETDSHFYSIAGPEIVSKYYGESEKKIREVFEQANKNAPSIIFIDEIDSIAPKRGEGKDNTEKRIVAQLLTQMDGLRKRGNVVVMAATNRPDAVDEALRRPGRFDREIKILPPNEEGRKEILQIHSRGMPLDKNVELNYLAAHTIGFTGADLEVLCKEAALKAIKPYVPSLKQYSIKVPTNVLEKIQVSMDDFKAALDMVEPSAMREVLIKKSKVTWDDVGGLEEIKKQLKNSIELPLKRPELFKEAGVKPPKGILLYGVPGTGKTLLAKAIAHEANANFISVKGPELISKWVGESEKRIREIFNKAKQVAPTVIFFDEFDSISKVRGHSLTDSTERMVNQLLTELDGIEELKKVTVIAATNRPDLIDPALIRPGRIEMKLEIPIPDEESREQIFTVHTKHMPLAQNVNILTLVKKTDGWSGAEIESLCREAGLRAIQEAAQSKTKVTITQDHFADAMKVVLERREKTEKNIIAH